ncbi:MAG: OmpA family protein [Crocinitomicaceae bacterium]|nr:OmpA family protein [Crocinitomicaceae bacterium]NGF75520.1 OmpA family protein [Fluviicola sp. SGL-29]
MKYICLVILSLVIHWGTAQNYSKNIDFSKLNIQFEDASAELKPEYLPLIYRLADSLRKTPDLHVTIRGHVCCVKRNGLAKRRAKVVRDYLLLFGTHKEQITTVGMKNSMPIVFPEKTKADELANMRVDFVLTRP